MNSVQNVSFPSAGGTAHGYLQVPAGGGPGVIVVQEWWGLTTHIASITERLRDEGFVALAPDLYGGPTTHDSAEAMELMQRLPADSAVKDLAGAVRYLLDHEATTSDTVGVIGFCMGGGFALAMAADQGELVSAAVPFYGLPADSSALEGLTAAVQGHFGELDSSIPVDHVRGVFDELARVVGSDVELHLYEAGHAFLNDENLIGTYDAEAAATAWSRAMTFLRAHVTTKQGRA